jgi:hypothetical protein
MARRRGGEDAAAREDAAAFIDSSINPHIVRPARTTARTTGLLGAAAAEEIPPPKGVAEASKAAPRGAGAEEGLRSAAEERPLIKLQGVGLLKEKRGLRRHGRYFVRIWREERFVVRISRSAAEERPLKLPRLPPPPPLPSPAPAPLRTGAEAEAAEAPKTVENAEVRRPLPARFRRNRLGSPPAADCWMSF